MRIKIRDLYVAWEGHGLVCGIYMPTHPSSFLIQVCFHTFLDPYDSNSSLTLVSRDSVRINEIMLSAPNYPLCSLFTSSYSWFGLILALGDILAAPL